MSLSLRTVLIIQNKENDIRCELYSQDKETKKWAGATSVSLNFN